jgi:hypothetical protein
MVTRLGFSLASELGMATTFAPLLYSYHLDGNTKMVELQHGMRKKNHATWIENKSEQRNGELSGLYIIGDQEFV